LKKVHREKTKREEEIDYLKGNAVILEYVILLLIYAKSVLERIDAMRGIVISYVGLSDEGLIPKDEQAILHLFELGDIEAKITEEMKSVDAIVADDPGDIYPKLSSTHLPAPKLATFDFESVLKEVEKINEEVVEPYVNALRKLHGSLQSKSQSALKDCPYFLELSSCRT
jgi:hypothetical protein